MLFKPYVYSDADKAKILRLDKNVMPAKTLLPDVSDLKIENQKSILGNISIPYFYLNHTFYTKFGKIQIETFFRWLRKIY